MGDRTEDPLGIESMIKTWTRSMNELMGGTDTPDKNSQIPFSFFQSQFQQPFDQSFQALFKALFKSTDDESAKRSFHSSENSEKKTGASKDLMGAIATTIRNLQSMAGTMASPESMTALFKGMGTMPEMLIDFTQSSMSGMIELQQKMAESASRMGQSVQAYKFDNMDENIFQAWSEIYEKEFRKFLQVPQLGLMREYQSKINDMTDKFNICQTHIAEFLRLLSLPFQRSALVMQEEIQSLADKGELSEDPQFYYQMWVKVLEGHFMTLFQTPEYIEALTKTVAAMSQFTSSKESVIEDMLRNLPVASRSELDDVARDLHKLKKEIRNLKKQLSESLSSMDSKQDKKDNYL